MHVVKKMQSIWHIMILPFSELSEIFGMEYAKLYKNKKTRFY